MRPACVWIDTRYLMHRERTTWAAWSYILLDSSATPPGLPPSLYKTGCVDKRSLSGFHGHKKHTFVIKVITESSETWEWRKLRGRRPRKGLIRSNYCPNNLGVGERNSFFLSSEQQSLYCPYCITQSLTVCQQIAKGWYSQLCSSCADLLQGF